MPYCSACPVGFKNAGCEFFHKTLSLWSKVKCQFMKFSAYENVERSLIVLFQQDPNLEMNIK